MIIVICCCFGLFRGGGEYLGCVCVSVCVCVCVRCLLHGCIVYDGGESSLSGQYGQRLARCSGTQADLAG